MLEEGLIVGHFPNNYKLPFLRRHKKWSALPQALSSEARYCIINTNWSLVMNQSSTLGVLILGANFWVGTGQKVYSIKDEEERNTSLHFSAVSKF